MNKSIFVIFLLLSIGSTKLIFEDDFNTLDLHKWRHDITLQGGGNWEFQLYDNNRSTTWAKDSKLNIRPILT